MKNIVNLNALVLNHRMKKIIKNRVLYSKFVASKNVLKQDEPSFIRI